AKYDDDLAAMAFEDRFIALRDDEFGKLGREKPLQPADTTEFLDLCSDTRLQTAVQFGDVLGALTQFAEQPGILHRDDRVRPEVLYQRNLLLRKRADLLSVDR